MARPVRASLEESTLHEIHHRVRCRAARLVGRARAGERIGRRPRRAGSRARGDRGALPRRGRAARPDADPRRRHRRPATEGRGALPPRRAPAPQHHQRAGGLTRADRARARRQDRVLHPAAGRDVAIDARDRRRPSGPHLAHRAAHLHRSAPRRRAPERLRQGRADRADHDRRAGVAALQAAPLRRRDPARHHRRRGRQHQHGAGGDPGRDAVDGAGDAPPGRHRHRAGQARGAARHAAAARR